MGERVEFFRWEVGGGGRKGISEILSEKNENLNQIEGDNFQIQNCLCSADLHFVTKYSKFHRK